MADGNFDIKQLSEGFVQRNVMQETKGLVDKWEKTGLLEGLDPVKKGLLARLLQNQAGAMRGMLSEATSSGDIMGFQNIAFPMVRRVFAGLVASELCSMQAMSLPSGLLFYLDYQFDSTKAGNQSDAFSTGGSVFGYRNSLADSLGSGSFFNLGHGFSLREKVSTGSFSGTLAAATMANIDYDPALSGNLANLQTITLAGAFAQLRDSANARADAAMVKLWVPVSSSSTSSSSSTDGTPARLGTDVVVYRRHTVVSGNDVRFVILGTPTNVEAVKVSFPFSERHQASTTGSLVYPEFESDIAATPTPAIPKMKFKLESVAVTTETRKLAAEWTPEMAQDLAAYQNMDAEVELTQVMSEQVALEIDQEILADMLYLGTGASYFWSRKPGVFVDKATGTVQTGTTFTGTVREWYETLVETVIDVSNTIARKTLRGAANFCVVSPDVATILEASVLYKPTLSMDPKETMFNIGTEKLGTLNNRFTVYKSPYFPRNKLLVGYKGSAFLETGYVYAPYVPLIVTPTIYRPQDFVPTRAVMTRYAKKMVRSDFYGSVTILDMHIV